MLSTRTAGADVERGATTAAVEKIQHQAAKVKGKWAERKRAARAAARKPERPPD